MIELRKIKLRHIVIIVLAFIVIAYIANATTTTITDAYILIGNILIGTDTIQVGNTSIGESINISGGIITSISPVIPTQSSYYNATNISIPVIYKNTTDDASDETIFAVRNVGDTQANVTVQIYEYGAGLNETLGYDIPVRGIQLVNWTGASTNYSAVISSDTPVVAVVRNLKDNGASVRTADYEGIYEFGTADSGGNYTYYLPSISQNLVAAYTGTLFIQNLGTGTATIKVDYYTSADVKTTQGISGLAAGESWSNSPGASDRYYAVVESTQPLGIVVEDLYAAGDMLVSHTGIPQPSEKESSKIQAPFFITEPHGWNTVVSVSNTGMNGNTIAQAKLYKTTFGTDTMEADYVLENASKSFYLASSNNLPGTDVSHIDFWSEGQNISATVMCDNANTGQAMSYNVPKTEGVAKIILPFITNAYKLTASGTFTSKLAINNCNPNYGYTKVLLSVYNETGVLHSQFTQEIPFSETAYMVASNYPSAAFPVGIQSVEIEVNETTQPGSPCMGAVSYAVASGYAAGDASSLYIGIPLTTGSV